MRQLFVIIGFLFCTAASAQSSETALIERMKAFHQMMITKKFFIDRYIDDSLSYGHSNGWIENKKEFIEDLGTKIAYHAIKEDSIKVSINNNIAHIRFVADIEATMNGQKSIFHLRVMEVWVKKKKNWRIFARQAFK